MDLIDSLVAYVKEIKPYHTKIYGVDVEYRAFEDLNVSFEEHLEINTWLGVPFRDLSDFDWTLDSLAEPADVSFEDFIRERGWETSEWESEPWDPTTVLGEPYFGRTGLMYDNVIAYFDESISFELSRVTTDIDSCEPIIGNPWDPDVDGIDITDYTPTAIVLWGDVTNIMAAISTFEVVGSDVNDGVYGVVSSIYDDIENRTTVTVTIGPDPSGSGGKAKLSHWDNIEWDGQSQYFVPPPVADMCASTSFTEELVIRINFGWDDPQAGGWDNTEWDSGSIQIGNISSADDTSIHAPPTPPPGPADETSDQFWNNHPDSHNEYLWDPIERRWFHAPSGGWEFSLQPRTNGTPGDWANGLRANVVRITIDPGPDEGAFGFLFGDVHLIDTDGNIVASSSYTFVDYDEVLTLDLVIDNSNNFDYAQLLFDTFLYTTGPRVYLIDFDPE